MSYETLLVEHSNAVTQITINRPAQLNALSETVLTELKEVLTGIQNQSEFATKGLILTGSGEKAFIAGADIKAMNDMSPEQGEAFGKLGQEVTELFEKLPVPVIACVNGFALGGGCELAMSCDFIYASENAVFGQPEVNLGLIPGFGGCVRLKQYVGAGKAKELIYTGRNVKCAEAKQMGLVNESFETPAAMLEAARKTLGAIAAKSPVAISICKRVINESIAKSNSQGLEIERSAFKEVFSSADKKEGVAAFVEKRKPAFPGK